MHKTDDDVVEANYIKTLPMFVSIPRSGCNWFQPVLELYFNRHRVMKHPNSPSWMDGDPNKNPLWMHAHDNFHDKLDLETNKPAVFLYRNPVDVIYSITRLLGIGSGQIDEYCERYQRCYNKWAKNNSDKHKEVLVLKYEDLLLDPIKGVQKVHSFWESYHDLKSFDEKKAKEVLSTVGNKHSVNSKNGANRNFKNPESESFTYDVGRDQFRNQWGSYITNKVVP